MWEQQPIVTAATVAERIARNAGLEPSVAHRLITFRAGWLELEAA
jgi:hypothetical protein